MPELKFASYNIHKGVGLDRRRDPERIMAVLHELDADIVALQEADRRFGAREAVLPRSLLDEHHWQAAPVAMRPRSMGWHGNAVLVRRGIAITGCSRIAIPTLEPRGAVCVQMEAQGCNFAAVGMHLDLSGVARRRQIREVCRNVALFPEETVLMGDLNEWSREKGALRGFEKDWSVLAPGLSFPSRRPIGMLDRIIHSSGWRCSGAGVHHSALAARASDHLPVWAMLAIDA